MHRHKAIKYFILWICHTYIVFAQLGGDSSKKPSNNGGGGGLGAITGSGLSALAPLLSTIANAVGSNDQATSPDSASLPSESQQSVPQNQNAGTETEPGASRSNTPSTQGDSNPTTQDQKPVKKNQGPPSSNQPTSVYKDPATNSSPNNAVPLSKFPIPSGAPSPPGGRGGGQISNRPQTPTNQQPNSLPGSNRPNNQNNNNNNNNKNPAVSGPTDTSPVGTGPNPPNLSNAPGVTAAPSVTTIYATALPGTVRSTQMVITTTQPRPTEYVTMTFSGTTLPRRPPTPTPTPTITDQESGQEPSSAGGENNEKGKQNGNGDGSKASPPDEKAGATVTTPTSVPSASAPSASAPPKGNPPSSSPAPSRTGPASTPQGTPGNLLPWTDFEKVCIVVQGPSNATFNEPGEVIHLSWSVGGCKFEAAKVGPYTITLLNNVRVVPKGGPSAGKSPAAARPGPSASASTAVESAAAGATGVPGTLKPGSDSTGNAAGSNPPTGVDKGAVAGAPSGATSGGTSSQKRRRYMNTGMEFYTRRDFSPNAQVQYDFSLPIANTSNTTNSYDWSVPYLMNDTHIRNSSAFYIRVQTTSYSGVFGATPPLAGTFGPFAIDVSKPAPKGYVLPNSPGYLANGGGNENQTDAPLSESPGTKSRERVKVSVWGGVIFSILIIIVWI